MDWRLALILVLCPIVQVTQAIYASEEHAQRFLRDSSARLYNLYNNISDETYEIDNKLLATALEDHSIARKISALVLDISKEAKKYNTDKFRNRDIIKGIKKLRSADLFVLEDDFFSSLASSLGALKKSATQKGICNYLKKNECDMAYLPDVRKIYSESLDPRELQYYWEEWREKHGVDGQYNFITVVELFRKAAELNALSVKDFWFRQYDDTDLFEDMEIVWEQLKPFYQEFHAYIRRELILKYGHSVLNQNGPIPHHLLEQVLQQAWKKQSVLSQSYPKTRLPNLQEGLEAQGFDITKILDHAEDFYVSLGLDPIPPYIRYARFKGLSVGGQDCKADIFDKTAKVYLKTCHSTTFKRFLQTHGYIGRVHYALEKANLPFYHFSSFDLEYPLGEAVILSASTPKHMNRAEILNQYNYTNELAMNRLFRMGVHTMFNLALHFVNTKVMVDALEARIPLERVNQHFWKLLDEYAGIEPPVDRKLKYIDFSYKFYEDLAQNHQTRKFISEVLGYQMYESFCLTSREFVPGDPDKPLHTCDFYGNKEVGKDIKSMMKMGSSETWRVAMSRAVQGSPAMTANSILTYYQPLHEWLRETNRRSRTKIGWNPSTRVVL